MNIMKKIKFLIIVFVLIYITIIGNMHQVIAASTLYTRHVSVSCVYNDGRVITKNYDDLAGTGYATIKDYPVRSTKKLDYNISDYRLLNIDSASCVANTCSSSGYNLAVASELKFSCPSTFTRWLTYLEGDKEEYTLVYYTGTLLNGTTSTINGDCRDNDQRVYCYLKKNNKTGWFSNKDNNVNFVNLTGEHNSSDKVDLVAERITFNKDFVTTDTCNYVYKTNQAAGSNKYISVYTYLKYTGGNVYYLDDGESMTTVDFGSYTSTCRTGGKICVNVSKRELSSAEGANEYNFSSSKHLIQPASGGSCPAGYVLYEYISDSTGAGAGGGGLSDICSEIPNTAIVLARILDYIQIIVPALVIIYTGIDIGRIIIAGNVEEELPKRKKSIIIRLVIMITFFFIPLIIKVVLGNIYGTDVGTIDCLYSDEM